MDFEAFRVDHFPVDQDLLDAGSVGPELAHLAGVYRHSPRALVWRNPSSDWRLFVLLLPLASRLSLMANPIFAQLTRAWGLNVRFVGVDRTGLCYDFRALLTDRTLKLLLEFLECDLDRSHDPAVLDTLFAALAGEMLTILQQRRSGWDRHLAVEHRLEPDAEGSLFARASRYPDFLAKLREALRTEIIDVAFYGRALRSIDLRETTFEQRVASLIEGALDEVTMAKLVRTGAGKHLGCYNWLRIDPRHAASRAHVLGRLPGLASFLAQTLLPLEARRLDADEPPDPRRRLDDAGLGHHDLGRPGPGPGSAAQERRRVRPAHDRRPHRLVAHRALGRGLAPRDRRRTGPARDRSARAALRGLRQHPPPAVARDAARARPAPGMAAVAGAAPARRTGRPRLADRRRAVARSAGARGTGRGALSPFRGRTARTHRVHPCA